MGHSRVALALGARLRAARLASGLTQQQLAERAEMDPAEICRYEKGARTPRLDTLVHLAGALGLPASAIVCGEEQVEAEQEIAAIVAALRGRPPQELRRVRELVDLILAAR